MKKIFLKNGIDFRCELMQYEKVRTIHIYDPADTENPICLVRECGVHSSIIFGENVTEMTHWVFSSVNEIYANFDFFWNNLNQ